MIKGILILGDKKNKLHLSAAPITLDDLDDLHDLPVKVSEKTDYFENNYK